MMNLFTAPINATAAGDNIIIPAQSGKVITVVQYTISPSAALTAQWFSGAVPLSGPLYLASGVVCDATGTSSYQSLNGVFQTLPGEALILNLSAPTVGGHLVYRISLA